MRLITAAHLEVPAGRLLTCTITPSAAAHAVPDAPPSFNQVNHALGRGATGGWLCVTAQLPDAPDRAALAAAALGLVHRHEALRTAVDLSDPTPRTMRYANEFGCTTEEYDLSPDGSERHAVLLELIESVTHSTTAPNLLCAAVAAADRTHLVIAVDHGIADAVSMPVLARDFVQLYDAARARDPEPVDRHTHGLPKVGSFLDACRAEAADHTDPEDPRVAEWHEFFRRNSHGLPRFPLPEHARREGGVAAIELRHVLDADETTSVEAWARDHDARLPALLLAVCARALHRQGLSEEFTTLLPVGTRSRPEWRETVGWFVSNGPVVVPGTLPLEESIGIAQRQVGRAQHLAAMRLGDVIASYPEGFAHTGDVGMVSYVDYRRTPGHETHERQRMTQVSPDAPTSDVQLWWVRDESGLALRCRLPDTAAARDVVGGWLDLIERTLRALAA